MSDLRLENLFLRFQREGDVGALAAVFDRTAGEVMRVAEHLARDRNDAEDLVQDTFLAAIEFAERFEGERALMPWLLGILVNQARRTRRRVLRRVHLEQLDAPEPQDPGKKAEANELSSDLTAAIARLRDPYRQVLELHIEHGLEPVEIASVLRRPAGTVRAQVHRGLELLRRALPRSHAVVVGGLVTATWLQSPAAAAMRTRVLGGTAGRSAVTAASATVGAILMKKLMLAGVTLVALTLLTMATVETWSLSEFATTGDRMAPPVVVPSGEAVPRPTEDAGSASEVDIAATFDRSGVMVPPLAGMVVRVRSLENEDESSPLAGALVAVEGEASTQRVTAEDGSCVLPVASGDGKVSLRIEAVGHHHVVRECRREAIVNFGLYPLVTLRGFVRDAETGDPVGHAEIAHSYSPCEHCEPEPVHADDLGRFEVRDAPLVGRPDFVVRAQGYAVQSVPVRLPAPGLVEQDIEIHRGVAVSVRVTDFENGEPLAGVEAKLGDLFFARSDAHGLMEMLVLPYQARVEVNLDKQGYCRLHGEFPAHEARGLIQASMLRWASASGTVTDAEGRPIAGARVRIRYDNAAVERYRRVHGEVPRTRLDELPPGWGCYPKWSQSDSAETDGSGRFTIAGLIPWRRFQLVEAWHPDHRRTRQPIENAGPGKEETVALTMERLGATGVVTGCVAVNGDPVDGSIHWKGPTRNGFAQCDQSGGFTAKDVEVGEVFVTATTFAYALDWGGRDRVRLEVREGQEQSCDFDLQIEFSTISGRVLRDDGQPLAGVMVCGDPNVRRADTSDESGFYSLQVPSVGTYLVQLCSSHWTLPREQVVPGSTGIDFVVPTTGKVRWRVVDGVTGKAIDEHWTIYSPVGRDTPRPRTVVGTKDGEWQEAEFPVGRARFRTWAFGYRPTTVETLVASSGNEPMAINIELQPGEASRFSLAGSSSELPQRATAYLLEESLWDRVCEDEAQPDLVTTRVRLKATGEFMPWRVLEHRRVQFRGRLAEIHGLAPGRYRFKVFGTGLRIEPEYLDVRAGEPNEFVVEVR